MEVSALVSFEKFVISGDSPIYLQIIRYLKRSVVAGTVADGEEMPSRRVLSALLGVNPNTIQKAYRLMEEEGLIQSHAGAKSYMVLTPERVAAIRRQLLEEEAMGLIAAMRQMGVEKEEALSLMEELWEGGTQV